MLITPNMKGYWRFEGNANDSSGNSNNGTVYGATFVDGINQVPIMTSNTTPAGEASASTQWSSVYAPWKAFNRTAEDSIDCWITENYAGYPQWLQYEFASSQTITQYAITTRNYSGSATPRSWVLYGSNTGAFTGEEDVLDTQTDGFPSAAQNERRGFEISSPGDYTYYRLYITAGWQENIVSVAKLELLTDGKFGQCYSFDGDDDSVNCSNGILTTNNEDFTVTAWVYPREDVYQGMIAKDPGGGTNRNWFLATSGDTGFRTRVYQTVTGNIQHDTGTGTLPLNTWSHIALVVDVTNGKLYKSINGSYIDWTSTWDGTIKNETIDLTIGWFYSNDYAFNGLISEVMIFDKALSQSDIQRVMMGLHPLNG